MAYFSSNSLLHSTQSGFQPNHSCETSLLQMINKWLDAINRSQMIGMVMIDFRKAFDLVVHTLLLKKLTYHEGCSESLWNLVIKFSNINIIRSFYEISQVDIYE